MLALYELDRVLMHVRVVRCMKPLFCLATVMWEPGIREHPIFLHDTLAPTSFCTGIPVSYRIIGMLPRHHFRFVAVAPLSFYHGDTNALIMLMSTFNKTCIKLEHVIRIMLTTLDGLNCCLR